MNLVKILSIILPTMNCVVVEKSYTIGVIYNGDSLSAPFYRRIIEFAETTLNKSSPRFNVVSANYTRNDVFTVTDALYKLLEHRVIAVITLSSSSNTALEAEFLSAVRVPIISTVATDPFLYTPQRNFLIRLSPSDNYQSCVLFDILKDLSWNDFSILSSNDDYGINGVLKLQDLAVQDTHANLKVIQNVDQNTDSGNMNITRQLSVIRDSLVRIIVLNTVRYTEDILKQARDMALLEPSYAWILTDSATQDLKYLISHGNYKEYYEGLIGITPTWQRVQNSEYYSLRNAYAKSGNDLTELSIAAVSFMDAIKLIQTAMESYGSIQIPQVINCTERKPWEDGEKWLEALKSASFNGASGKVSFDDNGMIKRKIYAIMNLHDATMRHVGLWKNNKLNLRKMEMIYLGHSSVIPTSLANSLSGTHLKFGIIDEQPCASRKRTEFCRNSSLPDCWQGYCIDITTQLSLDLNFTFNLIEPPDKKFGRYHEELARYTGLVYELQQRNIDVAGVILNVNTERLGAVDFLDVIMHTYSVSVYEYEEKGFDNPLFFTKPFDTQVWLTFMLIIVFLGILVTCVNAISPLRKYRFGKYGSQSFEGPFPNCSHMFIISSGLVGSKGRSGIPYSPAARFIILGWWFFTTIVLSMYTANLTAFITIDRATASIQSLEDLLSQDTYSWGLTPDTSTESVLFSHNKYRSIALEADHLLEADDIIKRVHEGNFVFIAESLFVESLFHNDCNTTRFVNQIPTQGGSYAVPKNVPYKSVLSRTLLSYVEKGYIEKLKEKWITPGKDICNKDAIGTKKPFKMAVFSGLFIMLLFGLCASVLILMLEFIVVGYLDWRHSQKGSKDANNQKTLTNAIMDIARTGVIPQGEAMSAIRRRSSRFDYDFNSEDDQLSDES